MAERFHLAALRERAQYHLAFLSEELASFMCEAADEIERQQAEIKRLTGELRKYAVTK